jgi:hypothetical protein
LEMAPLVTAWSVWLDVMVLQRSQRVHTCSASFCAYRTRTWTSDRDTVMS